MKIRKAELKDVEDLWPAEVESRLHHKKITKKQYYLLNKSDISEKSKKSYLKESRAYLKNKKTITLVAEENGKIIGYIAGILGNWDWSDEPPSAKVLKIDDIVVLKKYQRKGIGKGLLKKIEDYAKKKKMKFAFLNVWITNNPAIKFYEKNGYDKFMMNMVKKLK